MTRLGSRNQNTMSAIRVLAAALLGGVVGVMVRLLLRLPRSGQRAGRLPGITADVHERARTAEGNVESQARQLAEQVHKAPGVDSPPEASA